MFTKPIDEITFEDVKTFCQEWAEGVRVEYKHEIKVNTHIPKIVSSFANTHGGIFLIGVEADKTTNMPIFPISGIPNRRGIEEQIQQSTEMSINPPVRPEVKVVNIPGGANVVVVIRVTESSLLAPHAIEDSTKVYFRVGSVSQPYELKLANMELIAHMFKRRENSQLIGEQILQRINERARHNMDMNEATLTVIAQPIFPHRPVISTSDIYELPNMEPWPPRRVAGGVFCFNQERFLELNEYGIVFHRTNLGCFDEGSIEYGKFIQHIDHLISNARDLYKKCEYIGNIEVTAQLLDVYGKDLIDSVTRNHGWRITDNIPDGSKCFDRRVFASQQCLPSDLEKAEKRVEIIEKLIYQLIWAFNIPINDPHVRKRVRNRIECSLS